MQEHKIFIREATLLRVVSLTALLLFVWVGYDSWHFPPSLDVGDVGPAGLPIFSVFGGAGIAVLLFISSFTKSSERLVVVNHAPAVFLAGLLISLWVFLMPYVGFYLVTIIVAPLIMLAGGERRLWLILLSTISFWLFIHFVFGVVLHIHFPEVTLSWLKV